jgi:hypothetical protein
MTVPASVSVAALVERVREVRGLPPYEIWHPGGAITTVSVDTEPLHQIEAVLHGLARLAANVEAAAADYYCRIADRHTEGNEHA